MKKNLLKGLNLKNIVCYGDTDSCALSYDVVLKQLNPDYKSLPVSEIIDLCLKIDKEIQGMIDCNCEYITKEVLLCDNFFHFETEEQIEKFLITSKKKYIAKINYDKTTNRFLEDEYVVKGMEFKKSNLSEYIKGFLKKLTVQIMNGMTEQKVIESLRVMFHKLSELPVDDISYVQGVKNIKKYQTRTKLKIHSEKRADAEFPLRCPYHVIAAMVTNYLIRNDPDLSDMTEIREGDKANIVFVCPNNLFGVKAIAYVDRWNPKLEKYFKIDIEYLLKRVIIGPMKPIFDAVGYKVYMSDILQFKFLDSANTIVQTLLFQ